MTQPKAAGVDWDASTNSVKPSTATSLLSPSISTTGKFKAATARNPISLRLYKILGTTYNDNSTREALLTLSEFYRPPEESPSIVFSKGKEVDRDNDVRAEDDLSGDASFSTIFGKANSPNTGTATRARKDLRHDVECRVSKGSQGFLKAFQEVDNKLDALQEHAVVMRTRCDEVDTQLKMTNEACKLLFDRAGGLRALRHAVNNRKTLIDAFLTRFTFTQEEYETIQSRDVPVGKRFFKAMEKTTRIREDCRVLMAGEDGPTKAGLDIMAMTSQQLELGFEKLVRWCSLELRQLGRDTQLEVGPVMQEAIRWLRRRPELLHEVLSVLSLTRQSTILVTFMDALTRGGPNGLPRPIEIHAHDPLRYVGDMLAWVHQAIAGEREFLEGLFDLKVDRRMVGSVRNFDGSEEEEQIQELMDSAFGKLGTPLKARIGQTIRSQESCITSYKVANMLQFYSLTMRRTIGDKAMLSKTLDEITDGSYKSFSDIIHAQARSLARALFPDDQDEQPPLAIRDHAQVLREIMAVYDSSLLGDESEAEIRSGFQSILDIMIDAALDMCLSAPSRISRPTWDKHVFMLNCLSHLLSTIKPFSFADYKVKTLQDEIDAREIQLIEDHYKNILKDAHLDQCVSVCESDWTNEPLSHLGAMQAPKLEEALWHFSEWLSTSDVVQSPRLSRLIDQQLNRRVHHAALQRLANAYDMICTEVRKPENRYEAANTTLGSRRPFGQMTALRQILGLDALTTNAI